MKSPAPHFLKSLPADSLRCSPRSRLCGPAEHWQRATVLTARADPNVLLNMSVETPMGGAAYNDQVGVPTGCTGRLPTPANPANLGACYFPAITHRGISTQINVTSMRVAALNLRPPSLTPITNVRRSGAATS